VRTGMRANLPAISGRGAVSVGALRCYQLGYRNSTAFCRSSKFNLTNGLAVQW